MLVYIIPLVITVLGIILNDFSIRKRNVDFLWKSLCVYLILLMGLRYRVGMDTLNYMDSYDYLPILSDFSVAYFETITYQPLYLLLCIVAKAISSDFYVLQIFHAAILNLIIFYFISKNTRFRFFAAFFYLISYFLYFNTEIMRESLAVVFFLLNLSNFRNKEWGKYYLLAFVSFLFHISAIIIFLFPLFSFLKLRKSMFLILIVWTALLPTISLFIISLSNSFSMLAIYNTIQTYAESESLNVFYRLRNFLYISLFPLLILFYNIKIRKRYIWYENLICIYIFIGVGCFFYPVVFERFSNYIWPISVLMISDTIAVEFRNRNSPIFTILPVIFLFFVYINVMRYSEYQKWIPYRSIFNPEKILIREIKRDFRFDNY